MPSETPPSDQSVIRRKTRVADSPAGAGGTALTRLWHMTLPRVADELLGLQAAVRSVVDQREAPAAFCGGIAGNVLLLRLAGPDLRQGLAIIDAGLLAALTEVQMTGHVTPAPPPERAPTPTDAAICADVVDAWIAAFEAGLAELGEPHGLTGLRQSTILKDARAAEMALGAADLMVVRIALDLGGGAKQGVLTLAAPPPARAGEVQRGGPLGEQLKPVLMDSEAELIAILHRTFLPYGRISSLAPGDTIDVPRAAIGSVTLETVEDRPVVTGRLGQAGGLRAVRVEMGTTEEGAEAMVELAALPAAAPGDLPGMPPPSDAPDLPDLPGDAPPPLPDLPPGGDLPPLDGGADDLPALGGSDVALPDADAGRLPPLPDLPDIGAGPGPGLPDGGLPDLPDLPMATPPLPDVEDPG